MAPFKLEHIINSYITVRMEGSETIIYVAGQRFRQCKTLILNVPQDEFWTSGDPGSIDEMAASVWQEQGRSGFSEGSTEIPPEVEFWGHCSNLEAWADAGYDSRLLHRNLAFPLLKALADAGDLKAKVALGREVASRLASNYGLVVTYLVKENYLQYLALTDLVDIPSSLLAALALSGNLKVDADHLNRALAESLVVTWKGKPCGVYNNGVLDLSKRGLNDLSELRGFDGIQDLFELNLTGNNLRDLPPSLSTFPSLRMLTISGNKFTAFPTAVSDLLSIQELWMVDCNLQTLPSSIGKLQSLQRCFFAGNELMSLPEELGCLQMLKILHLGGNQIARVPSKLGDLPALWRLSLEFNQLTSLPLELSHLASLREIYLAGNQFALFPAACLGFPAIEFLSLSQNQIPILPQEVSNLTSLHILDLTGNRITSLPPQIGDLPNLRVLLISQNKLTDLPREIGNLNALEHLSVELNPHLVIPPTIARLHHLRIIDLIGDQLVELPPELSALTSLEWVYLQGNPLPNLPNWLLNLPSLRGLGLDARLRQDPVAKTLRERGVNVGLNAKS